MLNDKWQFLQSEVLRDYRLLQVREDTYHFQPTGLEAGFVVCESADWVVVIPVTVDDEIVFVRQFRHGLRDVVLEVPGGVMEAGEQPAQTALRELQEETGYIAKGIQLHGPILPNPALHTARCHIAVARGCEPTGVVQPDPFELIEIERRPLASVSSMIASGELQHALSIAAFAITGVHDET